MRDKGASMRTIIAGSRSISNYQDLLTALNECGWTPTVVLCGDAPGVDSLGKRWAHEHKIPVEIYTPDWNRLGKAAGIVRNMKMGRKADALIAVWDGTSPGTRHMIEFMSRRERKVYIYEPHTTTKTGEKR
jgi:hypothetical protein